MIGVQVSLLITDAHSVPIGTLKAHNFFEAIHSTNFKIDRQRQRSAAHGWRYSSATKYINYSVTKISSSREQRQDAEIKEQHSV